MVHSFLNGTHRTKATWHVTEVKARRAAIGRKRTFQVGQTLIADRGETMVSGTLTTA